MSEHKSSLIPEKDPLEKTVISALSFLQSYNPSQRKDWGLEYLAGYKDCIGEYVAPDEKFDYSILAPLDRETLKSFRNGIIPNSVRGLMKLEKMGFHLPMNFYSQNFDALSVLAMVVLFGGSMDNNYSVNYHSRDFDFPRLERIKSLLSVFPAHTFKRNKNIYALGDNGLPIGRCLEQLGVIKAKAKIDSMKFPEYISDLRKAYDYMNTFNPTKYTSQIEVARNLLLDAVAVLYFTNYYKGAYGFSFPAQLNREDALIIGNNALSVMNSIFPDCNFELSIYKRPSNIKTSHLGNYIFKPKIKISVADNERIHDALATPVSGARLIRFL